VSVSPPAVRALIAERLARPASWNPEGASAPAKPTTPSKETDVALSDADVQRIAEATADRVWRVMAKSDGVYLAPEDEPTYSPEPTDPGHYWSGRSVFADLVRRVRDTQATLAELVAAKKES
jgi:hypothetical protein